MDNRKRVHLASWMQDVWTRAERKGHIERLIDKITKAETDAQLLAYAKQIRQIAK